MTLFIIDSVYYFCFMKALSEKIKELRKAKRLSQEELADKIGISQASYFQLEKGKTELSVERLFQIAGILEVSVLDFLEVVNQEQKQSEESKKIEALESENKQLNEWLYNAGERQMRNQILLEEGFKYFIQQYEADSNLEGKPFTGFCQLDHFEKVDFPYYPFFLDFIEKYRIPLIAFIATCSIGAEFEDLADLFFESMKPYSAKEEKLLSEYDMQKKVRERRRSLKGVDSYK